MSLRFRLIALVAIVLVISLALGGAIGFVNASRSVRTEMRSALLVGRQTVDNALRQLQASPDPQRDLDDFVRSFRGNRHLLVSVIGDAEASTPPTPDPSPFGKVPAWFERLVGVEPAADKVPIEIDGQRYGEVVIQTDPHNEILEVWNQLNESLIVLALFCGQTTILIYLFIGRALRPLDRLVAALERVGQGDYKTRIRDNLSPELARLRDSFNSMAERLWAVDAENHRLSEKLVTLQEQERSDIARDLHDEVGPFLFAINVDLANLSRLAREGRTEELPAHFRSASDAVRHVQRQVRGLLGRLRPIGLAEFGLTGGIGSAVEFWRRRHPNIEYELNVSPACERLDDFSNTTIYRIVQEALSNAARHANPSRVSVTVERSRNTETGDEEIGVEVTDNGQGMHESRVMGYGLVGIEDRVKAIGGRLTLFNRPDGGFTVNAVLPYLKPRGPLVPSEDVAG